MILAFGLALGGGACSGRPVANPQNSPPLSIVTPSMPLSAVPEVRYPVGMRVLRLHRGSLRPLPTLVFYPAIVAPAPIPVDAPPLPTAPPNATPRPQTLPQRWVVRRRPGNWGATPGLRPAHGRFPLVLYSHGLSGSPQRVAKTLVGWAAAGFVVAAPSYPYTHEHTHDYRRWDIVNQPDDARFVLKNVLRLNDSLGAAIDSGHIAAAGHSAGGYTTTGLFVAGHDPRLKAGVVLSGWRAPGAFAGPPARMLFLQGTADPVVPMAKSRAAYARVPWTKRYLILHGVSHANYLRPGERGYRMMNDVVLDFLRANLKREP
jgi:dienelactone hydrolase